MNKEEKPKPRGSLVWPIVLIGIGVLFLLSNLGIVDWELFPTLLRLWPLLLVAVGLDLLLGRRSGIWAGITIAIILALFTGGVWLVQTSTNVWASELVSHDISQKLGDTEVAEVAIYMGVGILEIDSMESNSKLISGSIDISEHEDVREYFEDDGDDATYELSTRGQEYYPSWLFNERWEGDKNWDLSLNDDVLYALILDTGVGVSEVDVSGLMLSSLVLDSGVGETTVFLPGTGQYDVNIDAGVGQVTVYIPDGIAVRMQIDTGLGNTSISGDFNLRNGYYYSDDFDTADDFVDLTIDGGVGEVKVIQRD
jgi:hypothetical protein